MVTTLMGAASRLRVPVSSAVRRRRGQDLQPFPCPGWYSLREIWRQMPREGRKDREGIEQLRQDFRASFSFHLLILEPAGFVVGIYPALPCESLFGRPESRDAEI